MSVARFATINKTTTDVANVLTLILIKVMNKITIVISDENDEVVAQGATTSPEIAEQLLAQLIKAGNF